MAASFPARLLILLAREPDSGLMRKSYYCGATDGQLWAAKLGKGRLHGEKMLRDFNEMKFEAITALY